MITYYIVKVHGPFKQYYSESTKNNMLKNQPEFTAMLRYARPFNTKEDAANLIKEKALSDCHVIDQCGIKQD